MEANVHCLNHFDVFDNLQHCTRCGRVFCGDCLVMLRGLPYCGACKTEEAMDVQSGVATANAQYATILRRLGALFIDGIIVGIPVQIFSGVVQAVVVLTKNPYLPFITIGFVLLLSFVVRVVYEALLLLRNGQTVGKMALKIKVVRSDGSPLTKREAWIRPIVRIFASLLCWADYIAAFFSEERTCIHDMAANTRVVNVP